MFAASFDTRGLQLKPAVWGLWGARITRASNSGRETVRLASGQLGPSTGEIRSAAGRRTLRAAGRRLSLVTGKAGQLPPLCGRTSSQRPSPLGCRVERPPAASRDGSRSGACGVVVSPGARLRLSPQAAWRKRDGFPPHLNWLVEGVPACDHACRYIYPAPGGHVPLVASGTGILDAFYVPRKYPSPRFCSCNDKPTISPTFVNRRDQKHPSGRDHTIKPSDLIWRRRITKMHRHIGAHKVRERGLHRVPLPRDRRCQLGRSPLGRGWEQ